MRKTFKTISIIFVILLVCGMATSYVRAVVEVGPQEQTLGGPSGSSTTNNSDAFSYSGSGDILQAPSFLTAGEFSWVVSAWQLVRQFSNIMVVLFLFLASVATTLNINISTYGVKKVLPTVIMATILANFSFFFSDILISLDGIIRTSFLNLGVSAKIIDAGSAHGAWDMFLQVLRPVSTFLFGSGTNGANFASVGLGWFIGLLLVIPIALMALGVIIMLWFRNLFLAVLIVLAPMALLSMALPSTQGLFRKWWGAYIQWMFLPAIIGFVLMLGSLIIKAVGTNLIGLLFVVGVLYLVFRIPFMMGAAIGMVAGVVFNSGAAKRAALYMPGVSRVTRGINKWKQISDADIKRLTTGAVGKPSGLRNFLSKGKIGNKQIFQGINFGDRPPEAAKYHRPVAPKQLGDDATWEQKQDYLAQKYLFDGELRDWESSEEGKAYGRALATWKLAQQGIRRIDQIQEPAGRPELPPASELYRMTPDQLSWLDRDYREKMQAWHESDDYKQYEQQLAAFENPDKSVKFGLAVGKALGLGAGLAWIDRTLLGSIKAREIATDEDTEHEKQITNEVLQNSEELRGRIGQLNIVKQDVSDTAEAIEKQAQATVLAGNKIIRQEREMARQRKYIAENQMKMVENELAFEGQNKDSALHKQLQNRLQSVLTKAGVQSLTQAYGELGLRSQIAEESQQVNIDELKLRRADSFVGNHNLANAIKESDGLAAQNLTNDQTRELSKFLQGELERIGIQSTGNVVTDSAMYLAKAQDYEQGGLLANLGHDQETREKLITAAGRHVMAWKRGMGVQGQGAAKARETAEKYVEANDRWTVGIGGKVAANGDYEISGNDEENLRHYLNGEVQIGSLKHSKTGEILTGDDHNKRMHEINANAATIHQSISRGFSDPDGLVSMKMMASALSISGLKEGVGLNEDEKGKLRTAIGQYENPENDIQRRDSLATVKAILLTSPRVTAVGVKGMPGKSGTGVGAKEINPVT